LALSDRDIEKTRTVGRRELLKLSPLLLFGAFALPKFQPALLKSGLDLSDWAAAKWHRKNHLAPTYSLGELTPFDQFPLNTYDIDDPGVDLAAWTLAVDGVKRAGNYTLAQIQALPKIVQNTRHICVEGWDVVGRFGGARISDFLETIGADTSARFLYFDCADGYYESLDMESALHPQSLLCYEMYDQPLTRGHGAPLRLSLPTKIGYKSAKYLTSLRVTNVLAKAGYWEDQGYSAYYGL
jgi:DMSO/TMAO reductase YedYZ molybdopterin-dependent catalytic subunit